MRKAAREAAHTGVMAKELVKVTPWSATSDRVRAITPIGSQSRSSARMTMMLAFTGGGVGVV